MNLISEGLFLGLLLQDLIGLLILYYSLLFPFLHLSQFFLCLFNPFLFDFLRFFELLLELLLFILFLFLFKFFHLLLFAFGNYFVLPDLLFDELETLLLWNFFRRTFGLLFLHDSWGLAVDQKDFSLLGVFLWQFLCVKSIVYLFKFFPFLFRDVLQNLYFGLGNGDKLLSTDKSFGNLYILESHVLVGPWWCFGVLF